MVLKVFSRQERENKRNYNRVLLALPIERDYSSVQDFADPKKKKKEKLPDSSYIRFHCVAKNKNG